MNLLTRKNLLTRTIVLCAGLGLPRPLLNKLFARSEALPLRKVLNIPARLESDGTWSLEIETSRGGDKFFYLNRSAFEIWNLIDGRRTEKEIAALLAKTYGISSTEAEDAVTALTDSLKEQNLVV